MKQVVVITGASRGLGLSLAQRFLEQGDTVYGISRSKKYWPQAKASVPHPECFFLHALDLTHEMRVKAFLQSVYRRAKKIDILINNAGYGGKV
ncbi:MAG: SDR family NAD(P)-dependent oxidoreductase, partial [Candidatus Omnitrophica bacterium]|nr:SDR family NAD(P)-dependent oxidoreductase [Candidatus Omnitrophota bacterium]